MCGVGKGQGQGQKCPWNSSLFKSSFSPFPESCNTLPLFLLLILKSGAYLYESVQLRGADVFAIQQLQVREMVECVCGVVAQAADRVWMVEGITERKRVQLWEGAEVH